MEAHLLDSSRVDQVHRVAAADVEEGALLSDLASVVLQDPLARIALDDESRVEPHDFVAWPELAGNLVRIRVRDRGRDGVSAVLLLPAPVRIVALGLEAAFSGLESRAA